MHPSINLIIGLIMVAGQAAAQETVDSVSLRFNWPVGLTARVDRSWLQQNWSGGRSDTISAVYSHRLRVEPHQLGRLIRFDSSVTSGIDKVDSPPSRIIPLIVDLLSIVTPGYVVRSDGELVEIADLDHFKSRADSLIKPLIEKLAPLSPNATALLQSITSEASLTNIAAGEWNWIVGAWIDADLEVGAVYQDETREPHPMLQGLMIPTRSEYSVTERTPCTDSNATPSCVKLWMYTISDLSVTRDTLRRILAEVPEVDVEKYVAMMESRTVELEVTVIAEPATLVPYLLLIETSVRAADPEMPSAGARLVKYDKKVARFSYSQ